MEKIDKAIEWLTLFKIRTIQWNQWIDGKEAWHDVLSLQKLLELLHNGNTLRIKPQPTYRPYANAEEFLKASKEHGLYIQNKIGRNYYMPMQINDKQIRIGDTMYTNVKVYNELFAKFIWIGGTPCGILEQ